MIGTATRLWHTSTDTKLKGSKCKRGKLYIAMEWLDFGWHQDEIARVIELWAEGEPLDQIAAKLDRDGDEVAILLMDLARRQRIRPRHNGVFGDG